MPSFTDNSGRAWPVVINVGTVKRVRELCGVNLLDAGDPKSDTLAKLAEDIVTLADVLYVVVKPEADRAGITDEQFGAALVGDAIAHGANALLEAIADFFPQPRKGLMLKMIAKSKQVVEIQQTAAAKAGEAIDALDPSDLLAKLSTANAGSSPVVSGSALSI